MASELTFSEGPSQRNSVAQSARSNRDDVAVPPSLQLSTYSKRRASEVEKKEKKQTKPPRQSNRDLRAAISYRSRHPLFSRHYREEERASKLAKTIRRKPAPKPATPKARGRDRAAVQARSSGVCPSQAVQHARVPRPVHRKPPTSMVVTAPSISPQAMNTNALCSNMQQRNTAKTQRQLPQNPVAVVEFGPAGACTGDGIDGDSASERTAEPLELLEGGGLSRAYARSVDGRYPRSC
ncbi:hypothetical protein EJ06DRAFT_525115 [Trichodelitschia bisporula]|uniref:Uncharacterized protein n=1 Tax=Trichodelitschia bisporula TaxID=703511 RepID=A0A6G1HJ48_9PEZI|nr:hypothetical protein EJ06DRAFT_525115 [Trichodelitschia bisporula]